MYVCHVSCDTSLVVTWICSFSSLNHGHRYWAACPQGPVRNSLLDEHFTSHHLVILAVKCSTLTLFCPLNSQAEHLHGIHLLRWEKVWWRKTFPNNEQKTDSAQCSNINFRKGIWGWLESWVPWKFWSGFIAVIDSDKRLFGQRPFKKCKVHVWVW